MVDDEPAPDARVAARLRRGAGREAPRRVPGWLARLFGAGRGAMAAELRGASNEKAKRELGWSPLRELEDRASPRRLDSLEIQNPKPKETANGLLGT